MTIAAPRRFTCYPGPVTVESGIQNPPDADLCVPWGLNPVGVSHGAPGTNLWLQVVITSRVRHVDDIDANPEFAYG